MKFLSSIALCFLLFTASNAQSRKAEIPQPNSAIQNPQSALPISRVILYSNGIAYLERRGAITGNAEINLSFKQSQVDDVLKSLIVLDLGKGRIGAVSYNSSAPPSARLSEIPFDIVASSDGSEPGGMLGVLRQLQGAKISIATANRTASGALLTVEEKRTKEEKPQPLNFIQTLVIKTEAGELQSFDLSDVRSIKLLEEGTNHDLTEFANAKSSARRRDSKTITVTSDGEGARELIVSYTIAAPIWKTSYRVVLDAEGKPFFQGWAIVDNVSDEDWTNVQLSMVSGSPNSFIQPLQQPLYRHREVKAIPEDLSLDPQIVTADELRSGSGEGMGGGRGGNSGGGDFSIGGGSGGSGSGGNEIVTRSGPKTSLSDAITNEDNGIVTAATGNEIGDLFEYRVAQPVTVKRDRSALIPILQTKMQGERVSVFNEAENETRPMSGMLLKNTSSLTFESGAMTVLEGDAYAGEATIDRLKPGEEQVITFAVDLATLVSTRANELNKKIDRKNIFMVRAVNGIFQAHYYQTEKKIYTIKNQTDHPRIVFIEHPIRAEWVLSNETTKPELKTDAVYRFRINLAPHATSELSITENRALMDTYQISTLTSKEIELFVAQNYIDGGIKSELEKIIELKFRSKTAGLQILSLNREAQEISEDQKRLRENIEKLKSTIGARQLIARYIAKANTQETRLEQITKEKKEAEREQARLELELEKAVKEFKFDRKL